MKIATFGYARSGTTMLNDLVVNHLVAAGVITPEQHLNEPFNPREHSRLVPYTKDGRLMVRSHSVSPRKQRAGYVPDDAPPMTRNTRFSLFRSAEGEYVLKVLAQDTLNPHILPWLVDNGYHMLTIERRDSFEALLSWIIAVHHEQWHITEDDTPVKYKRFEADMDTVARMCKHMARYYLLRDSIPSTRIYYEDMVRMTPEEVVRHVGVYQEGVEAPATQWKKLLPMRDKLKLITNVSDVRSYHTREVGTIASRVNS